MLKTIAVNEIFGPTIQGEGKTAGTEVLFLRTSGCNLACIWCDTPYTWNWEGTKFSHPEKFDRKVETHILTIEQIITKLEEFSHIKRLVISGGEPLLQQGRLTQLCQILKSQGYWIEVETNGTIPPMDDFLTVVDQVNCSPKLANSGPDNLSSKREIPHALSKLARLENCFFKFVVSTPEDISEILSLVRKYDMKRVYLMPEGRTKEEQIFNQTMVLNLCEEYGFHFSPRLHVLQFGNQRGV